MFASSHYRLFTNNALHLTLKEFTASILSSNFNDKDKQEILEALRNNYTPGFNQAFILNNTDCIATFTTMIINSKLSEKTIVSLLEARDR